MNSPIAEVPQRHSELLKSLAEFGKQHRAARWAGKIAADLVEFAMLAGAWSLAFYLFGHNHPWLTIAVGMTLIPSLLALAHSGNRGTNALRLGPLDHRPSQIGSCSRLLQEVLRS